jgi:FtsZ-binding cell division protein ZapB
MVTLEQIKLLESKITRAIDVVTRLNEENLRLKKRNGELEELAEKLKNEKTRMQEEIFSVLDRFNLLEDAIDRSLDSLKDAKAQDLPAPQPAVPAAAPVQPVPAQTERTPVQAGPGPVRPEPVVPQAYLVDEEEAESAEEEDEDTGEAELDIF